MARRAKGLIVHVVRGRPGGVEVRPVPQPRSTLAKAGQAERELPHENQNGGSSPEKRALRVK